MKRDKGNGGCNWKKPTMTHSLEHQRRDTKHMTQKALTTHIFWILIKFTLSNNPFFFKENKALKKQKPTKLINQKMDLKIHQYAEHKDRGTKHVLMSPPILLLILLFTLFYQ